MSRPPPGRNWKSSTDTLALCGDEVAPVATMALLMAADQIGIDVGAMLYASTAHCVEANTTGLTQRRFGVVVPPACAYARLHVLRSGGNNWTQQTNTTAGNTTGGFTGVDVVTTPSPAMGTERYLQTGAVAATSTEYLVTSATVDNAPAASKDRAFELVAALAPAVEEFEVNLACAVAVEFFSRTADLETL